MKGVKTMTMKTMVSNAISTSTRYCVFEIIGETEKRVSTSYALFDTANAERQRMWKADKGKYVVRAIQ